MCDGSAPSVRPLGDPIGGPPIGVSGTFYRAATGGSVANEIGRRQKHWQTGSSALAAKFGWEEGNIFETSVIYSQGPIANTPAPGASHRRAADEGAGF